MKLGIVGCRERNEVSDLWLVAEKLKELKPSELVSGGCPKGADRFAEKLSAELAIPITIFPAKIEKGMDYIEMTKEFYRRNKQIADYCDMLIAVVSKDRKGGTENTIKHFLKTHDESKLILL